MIDHFVLSCEVGATKPEAALYEQVEKQQGVDRNWILSVGDSIKADIEGPCSFGFRSMHIDEMLG
jgi:HAD superfamily hydrolase (TIGR01549 family)